MYTKEQLRRLLIPLMFEQVLTALMGSVDTIMADLWIRRKKRDEQCIKLSFHHRPILSLYRSI